MLQSGKGSRGHNIGVDIRDILQIHGPMAPIPMRPLLRWQPFLGIRLRLLHGWIPELPRGFHPTPMAVSTQYFRDCWDLRLFLQFRACLYFRFRVQQGIGRYHENWDESMKSSTAEPCEASSALGPNSTPAIRYSIERSSRTRDKYGQVVPYLSIY